MLREMHLTNFKLFREIHLELEDITVLIGPQGTGKSSVLEALSLLAQSAGQEGLRLHGPSLRSRDFTEFTHQHLERTTIGFDLRFEFEGAIPPITKGPRHTVHYSIKFDNAGFREQRSCYEFPERTWEFRTPRSGQWSVPDALEFENRPRVAFSGSTYTLLPFRFNVNGRDYPLHQNLTLLRQEMLAYMTSLQVVPFHRVLIHDHYPDEGRPTSEAWTSVDDVVNTLRYRWDLRDRVSDWLHRVVDRRVGFRQVGEEILVEVSNTLLHPIMNEGSGVRQLIWPLAALAVAEPGNLVAIEEPEIHLHPQAQAGLTDLLVELTQKEDRRVLLTTHSEHILMGFLTAVATGELEPAALAIYYLEEEAGVGTAQRLAVDDRGAVEGGLKGFFEAGLDELERYLEALSQKTSRGGE